MSRLHGLALSTDSTGRSLSLTADVGGHEHRLVLNGNVDAVVYLIDGNQVFVK